MSLTREVEQAIDRCYNAALMPHTWTDALDHLASALGGTGCNFVAHGRADRNLLCMHSSQMGQWQELWDKNVDWVTDLCSVRGAPRVREGARSLLQSDLFSDEEVRSLRFYREIAGPAECLHWASASFMVDGDAWCMPVYRATPYSRGDTKQFVEVSHHLERIIRVSRAAIGSRDQSGLMALERFGRAAMLIDRNGRVTRMNGAAETLMSEDFRVRGGKLIVKDRSSQDRIDAVLHAIASTEPDKFLSVPVAVVCRHGMPWLAIDTIPAREPFEQALVGERAILVISDLAMARSAPARRLELIFGFTPAEARLASALCRGLSLGGAAREFGVGSATVRSHLKSIFAKTGTARQAELVAVLARI